MNLLAGARRRAADRQSGPKCKTCSSTLRAEIEALIDQGFSFRVIADTLAEDAGLEISAGALMNHQRHRGRR